MFELHSFLDERVFDYSSKVQGLKGWSPKCKQSPPGPLMAVVGPITGKKRYFVSRPINELSP